MRNVILLTIDTLRKDVLGCYGNHDGLTPFIDSIMEKSVRFTKAHSVAPYTQPSFPGILTSSYIFDYPKSQQLSSKRTIISEALKHAGIYSAAFHSNPYLSAYFGWDRGWDHFYDSMEDDVDDMCPYIKGDVINRKVDDWLSSYVKGKDSNPFFLWTHYMDVHEPYIPAKRYIDEVDPSINLSREEMFNLFKEVVLKRDASNRDTVELLRKLYKAHVREIDDYTRMLFDILNRYNVLKESVVIITADHGEEFGDHGSLSHDGKMYSELVNVPLLLYNCGSSEGGICDTPVSGVDISPTVLYFFGLQPHKNFQGHSLFPLEEYSGQGCFGEAIGKLSHKIKESDRPVYYYREGRMKVIYREEEEFWELYDLEEDHGEIKNLINTSPLAEEMKNKLKSRIKRVTN